jgi:hypothetical protein
VGFKLVYRPYRVILFLTTQSVMSDPSSVSPTHTSSNASGSYYYNNDVVMSPIRERTLNAIAQHRAWRHPDLRRTYAGTSVSAERLHQPSSPGVILPPSRTTALPISSRSGTFGISSDAAMSIYEDIESSKRRQQTRDDSATSSSVEGHLQKIENLILSSTFSSGELESAKAQHRLSETYLNTSPTTIL